MDVDLSIDEVDFLLDVLFKVDCVYEDLDEYWDNEGFKTYRKLRDNIVKKLNGKN